MQNGGGDPRQATEPPHANAVPPPPDTETTTLPQPANGPSEPRNMRRLLLALLGGALGLAAAWRWRAHRRREEG